MIITNSVYKKIIRKIGYKTRRFAVSLCASKHIICNKRVNIAADVDFRIEGTLEFIGSTQTSKGDFFSVSPNARIIIGNNVYFGRNVMIVSRKSIVIGDDCMFGPGVMIYDHNHVINERQVHASDFTCDEVIIGKGCWVGAGVIILKGSIIGDNCVIGAGSLVSESVPANHVFFNRKEKVYKQL